MKNKNETQQWLAGNTPLCCVLRLAGPLLYRRFRKPLIPAAAKNILVFRVLHF